jgi:hypothetical protein
MSACVRAVRVHACVRFVCLSRLSFCFPHVINVLAKYVQTHEINPLFELQRPRAAFDFMKFVKTKIVKIMRL